MLAALTTPIEYQVVTQELRSAKRRGDAPQVASLEARSKMLMERLTASDDGGEFGAQVKTLLATLEMVEAFAATTRALDRMDLEAARTSIGEARAVASRVEELLDSWKVENVLLETSRRNSSGFVLLVDALDGYVQALHDAVVGDVTRDHVRRLERARRDIARGTEQVVAAARILRYAPPEQLARLESVSAHLQELVGNLGRLCERSLTPKQASRTAGVKFAFLFLVSFVVLLLTLPSTWLVERIGLSELGIVLLTSFMVGLIGGFGYEAMRFLPFVDRLIPKLEFGRAGGAPPEPSPSKT